MQNFLLDTQEKFKYSNWFSVEPGEGEGGRVAQAEFTQGRPIQKLDPVTKEEGHLEDTGRIWVSWYSWAPQACCSLDTPSCCAGLCQAGWQHEDSLGPGSSERTAVRPKQCVADSLASRTGPMLQRYCQNKAIALCSHQIGKGLETGPEGSQRPCPLPYR